MADLIVIALQPISVQEMEEIILEEDKEKAFDFLANVIKPLVDRGTKGGKAFFDDEPEPFFG